MNRHGRNDRGILSPLCLPIPPSGQIFGHFVMQTRIKMSRYLEANLICGYILEHNDIKSKNFVPTLSKTQIKQIKIIKYFNFYHLSFLMERETRFELATPTLARSCSTTELFPQIFLETKLYLKKK